MRIRRVEIERFGGLDTLELDLCGGLQFDHTVILDADVYNVQSLRRDD